MLFSDSVDDDNNYNDADSYNNISDNNVGDNDMNNNNSFRKYSLSYPEPPWKKLFQLTYYYVVWGWYDD